MKQYHEIKVSVKFNNGHRKMNINFQYDLLYLTASKLNMLRLNTYACVKLMYRLNFRNKCSSLWV